MLMMSGTVSLQADPKGRLRIPSKFRPFFGSMENKIYALINSNGCLNIISQEKADEVVQKLSSVVSAFSVTDKGTAARLILSSVSELNEDSQGRFTLPPKLKKFAGINKSVVFVGVGKTLELWDSDKWDAIDDMVNDPDAFKSAVASLEDIIVL